MCLKRIFSPAIRSIGRDTKFSVAFSFILYGYGFLSRGFTDPREILHGGSATSQQVFSYFGGIAPGMAEFWASTGAMWWDMLLAETLVQLKFCLMPGRSCGTRAVQNIRRIVDDYYTFCERRDAADAVFVDWKPVCEHFKRISPE